MNDSSGAFSHAALIVDSDESLRARLLPTLRANLDGELPILMVVGPHGHAKRESTKDCESKGRRSPAFSPTPT